MHADFRSIGSLIWNFLIEGLVWSLTQRSDKAASRSMMMTIKIKMMMMMMMKMKRKTAASREDLLRRHMQLRLSTVRSRCSNVDDGRPLEEHPLR